MTLLQRPKYRGSVYRLDVAVNVFSDNDRLGQLFMDGSFVDFCPEDQWIGQQSEYAYELWHFDQAINQENDFSIDYELEQNRIIVYASLKNLTPGETLPYLAYGLTELQGQSIGQATIHAAAISRENRSVLLIGGKGAGKTTIGLQMCLNQGFQIIGNDLVIVGLDSENLKALGGTKHFNVRLATARENFPILLPYFKTTGERDGWTERTIIRPEDISVKTSPSPVPIYKIFEIHISRGYQKIKLSAVNSLRARLLLYENLSKYISGVSLPLMCGDDLRLIYRPSFDNPTLHFIRARIIENIVGKVGLQHLSGSLEDVSSYLNDNIY